MKTAKMSAERKKTLRRLAAMMNTRHRNPFPITRPLLDCFDVAVTGEEAEFLVRLGTAPFTRAEAASRSGLAEREFAPFFDGLVRKGLIAPQVCDGGEVFALAGIMVGWFKTYLSDGRMTAEKREFARRLDALFKSWGRMNVFPLRLLLTRVQAKDKEPLLSIVPAGGAGGARGGPASTFRQQGLEGAQDGLSVRPGPVDLVAGGASLEAGLRGENERGHALAHLLARDAFEHRIAVQAARKEARQGGRSRGAENLPDLLPDIVALDEDEAPHGLAHQKPRVLREDDAPLALRRQQEFLVGDPVGIDDIESGDPEPLGQPAQHHVGDEARPPVGLTDRRSLGLDQALPLRGGLLARSRIAHRSRRRTG